MIAEELLLCASDNLVETYFRLGLAAPNARVHEDEGYRACLGEFAHPICNFAVPHRLDPWSARRLAALARSRKTFYVYVLPESQSARGDEILCRANFWSIYNLSSMVGEARGSSELDVRQAHSESTRDRVAEFMTRQFFLKQDPCFKDHVRWSTFAAKDLELHYLLDRDRPMAAVMLSRSPGTLGIYNLCVAPARRRRGVGGSLLRWCLAVANQEGRQPVLQCDPALEGWYSSLGFRSVGRINVYSLLQANRLDIMDTGSVI